jgi:hypothetical protein
MLLVLLTRPLLGHIWCTWDIDVHDVYIKSDSLIWRDPMILERLGDRRLLTKIPSHSGGELFFKICKYY